MPLLAPKEYVYSAEALSDTYTKAGAADYTRWLATHHYENFHVVTFLLPKRLHQDFYNVYSFCRWADDLGDEIGDREESLRLLAWWRAELEAMYARKVKHPVFVALEDTVHKYGLPLELFGDLISAFEQDQRVAAVGTAHEHAARLPEPSVACDLDPAQSLEHFDQGLLARLRNVLGGDDRHGLQCLGLWLRQAGRGNDDLLFGTVSECKARDEQCEYRCSRRSSLDSSRPASPQANCERCERKCGRRSRRPTPRPAAFPTFGRGRSPGWWDRAYRLPAGGSPQWLS